MYGKKDTKSVILKWDIRCEKIFVYKYTFSSIMLNRSIYTYIYNITDIYVEFSIFICNMYVKSHTDGSRVFLVIIYLMLFKTCIDVENLYIYIHIYFMYRNKFLLYHFVTYLCPYHNRCSFFQHYHVEQYKLFY